MKKVLRIFKGDSCIYCGRIIPRKELMCAACMRDVEGRKREIQREREARVLKRQEEEEVNAMIQMLAESGDKKAQRLRADKEFASRQDGLS